jgi:hypothetical protein
LWFLSERWQHDFAFPGFHFLANDLSSLLASVVLEILLDILKGFVEQILWIDVLLVFVRRNMLIESKRTRDSLHLGMNIN